MTIKQRLTALAGLIVIVGGVVGTLAIAGLVGSQGGGEGIDNVKIVDTPQPDGRENLEVGAEVGKLAPDFEIDDFDGVRHRLSDYRGKVVFVNFWATWCEPCREEFPELVAFEKEMRPKGVALLTVSLDMASALADQVIPFLKQQGVAFPCYIKAPGDDDVFINAVDPEWKGGLPATFIYARDGRLVSRTEGPTDRKRLTAAVTPLLESASK